MKNTIHVEHKPDFEVFFPHIGGDEYSARITGINRWMKKHFKRGCPWRLLIAPLINHAAF